MKGVFCGEFKCSADAKGRMFFPAKLRDAFPEAEKVILVRSLDNCINVYTEEKWNIFAEKIESLPSTEAREVKRFFYGSMQDVEFDSQGRVLLPLELRTYSQIEKQVIVLGCGDHAEIWDEAKYTDHSQNVLSSSIEEILRRNGL